MASDNTRDNSRQANRQPEGGRRQSAESDRPREGAERRRAADADRQERRERTSDRDRAEDQGADIEKRRVRNRRRQKGRVVLSVILRIVGCLLLAAFLFMAGLFIYCRCVGANYLAAVECLFTGRFQEFADTLNTERDVTAFNVEGFVRNEYADDSDRYVCCGGVLYKISNNSIVRYTETGNMAQETRIDMETTRYDRAGGYLLVYGMGSKRAYLVSSDMILTIDLPDAIRTATVNAGGYMAFVTEPDSCASAVAIYGPDGKSISTRYIQKDYAVWAGVAPDNSTYCIDKISLDDLSSSSYMEYSRIGDSNAFSQELLRDRLAADCVYLPCGRMVCISDSCIFVIGTDRKIADEYPVNSILAVSVTPGGSVVVAAVVAGSGQNENRIMIFDKDGGYSSFALNLDADTMDATDRWICISNSSGIVVMDHSGAIETSLAAGSDKPKDALIYGDSFLAVYRQTVDKRRF